MLLRSPTHPFSGRSIRSLRSAFTLLEVLVVVAIIVMLAGIGGYYILPQLEGAKIRKAKAQAEGLSGLAETYKLNNNEYPTTLDALTMPQPSGDAALCSRDKILDPWGQPFKIDGQGQHSNGGKADIYTVYKGMTIGNWGP